MAVSIDGHDVRVRKVALNEYLFGDLVFHLRSESLLGDDLKAADEAGAHMLNQVHLAVAPFIDKPNYAEYFLPTVELQPFVAAYS